MITEDRKWDIAVSRCRMGRPSSIDHATNCQCGAPVTGFVGVENLYAKPWDTARFKAQCEKCLTTLTITVIPCAWRIKETTDGLAQHSEKDRSSD